MEHFMVELFVRGLVLCLLAALALLLLRRSAAVYRHLLCVLALGGLLTLPLAQRLLPPLPVLQSPSVETPNQMTLPIAEAGRISETNANAELPQPQMVQPESATVLPPDNASLPSHMATMTPAVGESRSWNAAPVLLALWGIGATTLLIRLMVALLRLRKLRATGRHETLGSVPILVSERVDTPLTWGINRHVILLPQALLSGDPAIAESALRHEQAHIARWDWIWNLLAEIVCALCWFQPGAWWLRRRMRMESERACDDRVLLSGIAGPDYAAHLLHILRSVRTHEVAPAMAHSGSMEERMQHILDTHRPRHAPTKWLAASASLALVLLSCAALRVSARPAATKSLTDADAPVFKSGRPDMPSQPSTSPLPAANSSTPDGAEPPFAELPPLAGHGNVPAIQPGATMAQAQPGTTLPQSDSGNAPTTPVLPVGHIVWGDVVDGLQPGFLLKTPTFPANRLTPLNSQVTYQVLVRNTTRRERVIETECQDFTDMDPYLIPGSELRQVMGGDKIPESYRAIGVMEEVQAFPAYPVKLAAGEAVVLPNVLSLYVGDADKQSYPRVEQIKPGRNWIVQPIAIHSLTPAEADEALAGEKSVKLTILGRDGKPSIRSTTWRAAGSGGKRLYAKIPLEVGGVSAKDGGNPESGGVEIRVVGDQVEPAKGDGISWGEEHDGYRYGLRIAEDVGIAEIWVQNRAANTQVLRYPTWPPDLNRSFEVRDSSGRRIDVPVTRILQESRMDQKTLRPGEKARVYLWPMDSLEHPPLSRLPSTDEVYGLKPEESYTIGWTLGAYKTGRASFRAPVQNQVVWGSEREGLRLGLRLPRGTVSFTRLSQARFEVLLNNTSGKRITCGWMGYPTINQFSPEIFTPKGKTIQYVKTLAGPYTNEGSNLAPGETAVLGTISLPEDEAVMLDAFPVGVYHAEFELTVTLPNHKEVSLKSRMPFTVAAIPF